ncbi:MAG: M56 family metallopeptidase, partial [Thermoanaerobaculia bacterium]|nr:M56 family metallopeptidase [Thermoanaerobaculia bacterium]
LRRLVSDLEIDRALRLAMSERIEIPVTWGVGSPVVVLPASASGWSDDLLDSVLLHALAHVRRNDAVVGLGAAWVRALYWPHPLVWMAHDALRRESEVASDDTVIRAAVPPVRYAEHLLCVVEELRRPVPQAVAAMATHPQLTERIGSILDPSRHRATPGRRGRLTMLAGATLALLLAAVPVKPTAISDEAAAFATLGSGAGRAPLFARAAASSEPAGPLGAARTRSSEGRTLFDAACGDGSSSTSVATEEDWTRIRVAEGRCEIRIESTGTVEFTADERAVRELSPGGRLVIEERRVGATHRLEVAADSAGRVATVWRVDGETVPFDRSAEAWLAGMIPQIYRLTGWQAEERVERILAADGVDGVLAEVRLIHGDHVQAIYLVELLERAALAGEELERWLDVAGAEIGSDHELARVLMEVSLGRLSEAGAQRAFVAAASTIGSDHALRETLDHLVRSDDLSIELLRPLLRVAGTIGSDFELTELVISICRRFPAGEALPEEFYEVTATIGSDSEMRRALAQLVGRPLTSGDLARALRLSQEIGSDFELAELLIDLLDQLPAGEPLPSELYEAVGTIGSDHEMARVLARLIDRPLGDDGLVRVLETSRQIGSDFELAELLVGLVRRHGDPAGARGAFEATVDTIGSSTERARVLDAWRHAGV